MAFPKLLYCFGSCRKLYPGAIQKVPCCVLERGVQVFAGVLRAGAREMCCVHNPLGGYEDFQAAIDVQADHNIPDKNIPFGYQHFQGLGIILFMQCP